MKSQLYRIFERITSWLDSFARARAASELANNGFYKEAHRLINQEDTAASN